MSTLTLKSTAATGRLHYLPVSLFGSVMGLTGLSVAWRLARGPLAAPDWPSDCFAVIAALAFLAMTVAYFIKFVTGFNSVLAEFRNPISGNMFGTILISMLLFPIVLAPVSPRAAQCLWITGVIGMVGFAWLILNRWLSDRQQVAHATPAWIVPIVGLLDVPLATPYLDLPQMPDAMIACLGIGFFFSTPLFTLIFSRLLFEPPLPDALRPTLMILVAPFSVGFSAYVATTGQVDIFARALCALTLFMVTALLNQLRSLFRCCPFRVTWWAVSFPLAASAGATVRLAAAEPGPITDSIAGVSLGVATIVTGALIGRTALGIARGELRNLSG